MRAGRQSPGRAVDGEAGYFLPRDTGRGRFTMAEPLGQFCNGAARTYPLCIGGTANGPTAARCSLRAAADSYIPLLWSLDELVNEGISPRVVISISPVTMEQLV